MIAPLLTGALLALAPAPLAATGETVAIQAGTVHLVEDGEVLEGGATILVRDGKIVAVGPDLRVPPGTRVVDYGPDAVIVPGLVCAESDYGFQEGEASPRTAAPTLHAIDGFDSYTPLVGPLRAGITSVYLTPARGRLIAGRGAVVKTYGDPGDARVVSRDATLQGSITVEARQTPGYWVPPVPATVDVGLGVEQPQLPRTTMGAVVALEELVALQAGDERLVGEYGLDAAEGLKQAIAAGLPWRMGADTPEEVHALLELFGRLKLPLVLDGASGAADLADDIAAAGVAVFSAPPFHGGQDRGKGDDAPWPRYDTTSRLMAAGVHVAIVPPRSAAPENLRLSAGLAMRGGMTAEQALRAITLTPAELLGVADRVGSISPGKDADFAVLDGPPLSANARVRATWIGGEQAWKPKDKAGSTTVLEVDELYVGDGRILSPGQVLMSGGRIVEVGSRVAHPPGAVVVRGAAAMPGMIDSYGHLGLEGSEKSFNTRFDLRRIVEPGDDADRRVARAGVTLVNLASRRDTNGAPTLAYKPAGQDLDRMVVAAPATLRMVWKNEIRASSGEAVKKDLEKAVEYKKKWEEYEKELAAWDPAKAAEADAKADSEKKDDEGDDAKQDEKKDDESKGEDEAKKDEKKDKKKKGEEPPRPVTGEWNGTLSRGEGEGEEKEERALRVRLLETDLALQGTARVADRDDLLVLSGAREEAAVTLTAEGEGGVADLALTLEDGKLSGTWKEGEAEWSVALDRTSEVYPVAGRPERTKPEPEPTVKGKPKEPGIDPDLEPLRQAMFGKGAIVVSVDLPSEILDCVAAFEAAGIRPVLWGASGAPKVADRLRGRILGIVTSENHGALALAGIPVAFYSGAEEGALELPLLVLGAVDRGLGQTAALRGLTLDAARLLGIADRVGSLEVGKDADVLLLDGPALEPSTSVLRTWVSGEEVTVQ